MSFLALICVYVKRNIYHQLRYLPTAFLAFMTAAAASIAFANPITTCFFVRPYREALLGCIRGLSAEVVHAPTASQSETPIARILSNNNER